MDNEGSKIKSLVGGGIAGGLCSINLLFAGPHSLLDFVVKFFGLLVAALMTGFFTNLGTDFYKLKIKPRLFKNKIDTDADTKRVA